MSSEMTASRTRGSTQQYIVPVPVNSEASIYYQYTPLLCSLNRLAASACIKTHKCFAAAVPMQIAVKYIALLHSLDSKVNYLMQKPLKCFSELLNAHNRN